MYFCLSGLVSYSSCVEFNVVAHNHTNEINARFVGLLLLLFTARAFSHPPFTSRSLTRRSSPPCPRLRKIIRQPENGLENDTFLCVATMNCSVLTFPTIRRCNSCDPNLGGSMLYFSETTTSSMVARTNGTYASRHNNPRITSLEHHEIARYGINTCIDHLECQPAQYDIRSYIPAPSRLLYLLSSSPRCCSDQQHCAPVMEHWHLCALLLGRP